MDWISFPHPTPSVCFIIPPGHSSVSLPAQIPTLPLSTSCSCEVCQSDCLLGTLSSSPSGRTPEQWVMGLHAVGLLIQRVSSPPGLRTVQPQQPLPSSQAVQAELPPQVDRLSLLFSRLTHFPTSADLYLPIIFRSSYPQVLRISFFVYFFSIQ